MILGPEELPELRSDLVEAGHGSLVSQSGFGEFPRTARPESPLVRPFIPRLFGKIQRPELLPVTPPTVQNGPPRLT